ncbi:MAG: hypothetical protein P8170_19700 [Gemmatimonadota bacterium]
MSRQTSIGPLGPGRARRLASPMLFAGLASIALAAGAGAQLRPLDPLDWRDLEGPPISASLGADLFFDQRASLAGTSGRLFQLAVFRVVWRLDRVAVAVSGTPVRVFDDRDVFASPAQGALPAEDGRRIDAGDMRLSTLVRLNRSDALIQASLRFGVRLPTTDERIGLDRDQTDFFGTLGGRVHRGRMDLSGELGIGILGSRAGIDQTDPLLYGLRAMAKVGAVSPFVELTGQHDTRENGPRRGTEDLGEIRVGARVGSESWLSVAAVKGLATFSPGFGLRVRLGRGF